MRVLQRLAVWLCKKGFDKYQPSGYIGIVQEVTGFKMPRGVKR